MSVEYSSALWKSIARDTEVQDMVRLDHVVQSWLRCTGAPKTSLKEANRIIRMGHFMVDGRATVEPKLQIVPGVESVQLASDAQEISTGEHNFVLLNKPVGVVCQRHPRERSVYDLIPADFGCRDALACVGRLDRDTTGAILLCTDGGVQSMLLHPASRVWKTYRAELEPSTNRIDASAIDAFKAGLVLDDGTRCAPAELDWSDTAPNHARVTLHEGFFHQVKRMLAQVGGVVSSLHRERFGLLGAESLAPGQMRPLTPAEMASLSEMMPEDRVMRAGLDWDRSLAPKRPRSASPDRGHDT